MHASDAEPLAALTLSGHINEAQEEPVRWEARYRDYLLGEGLAHKTVTEYVRKMQRAEDWAVANGTHPTSMSASHVKELAELWPNTLASRGQLRGALKHYWEMLGRSQAPYKAVLLPKEEDPPPEPLEPDEYRLLIKTSKDWYPDGLAVLVGLFLGLRRGAIAPMRWDAFDRDFEWVRFQTKGRKVFTRPVHPFLRDQLRPHASGYPWVFPGLGNRPHVSDATINLWVKRVAEAAGIGHVNPHRLRATCATEMNDGGADIEYVAEFLGHVKLSTTRRYTRLKEHRLVEAMHALDHMLEGI
ncbi:MAG TPA: site-specific integrase [Longimicrobiales bacterium]|nr:site-specific integrase [Longimicrobiales bacterium]